MKTTLAAEEESEAPQGNAPDAEGSETKIKQALAKLHRNLGHPSTGDFTRILRHSRASDKAIELASKLQCTVCMNHQQPKSALPANVPHSMEFNEHVGLDVKYLRGWKVNHEIPCVNLVDYGTSLQVMVPLPQRETSALLKNALRDKWIAWAGVPKNLTTDPARPNTGEVFAEYCENSGISLHQTAADAHWQLGKVERHGQWFSRILDRVCDEVRPSSEEEWLDCLIQAQAAKNSLISQSGCSPNQLVFGRNPRIPEDLMQDEPHVVASDAVEMSEPFGRSHMIRQAARRSVLACQDDRALRVALRARPRVERDFKSGDWVHYWRSQKWQSGVLELGGKWHGTALILGRIGRNFVIAHRRSLLRCAPEQLRHASSEEKSVAEFPESELLGIKNLLEKGQFPKSQFTDIVGQSMPPEPEQLEQPIRQPVESVPAGAQSAAEMFQQQQTIVSEPLPPAPNSGPSASAEGEGDPAPEVAGSSSYGPVRRRYSSKQAQDVLFRPPEMKHEDFLEMMQEIVPQIVVPEAAVASPDQVMQSASPRGTSQKREASTEGDVPASSRPRIEHEASEGLFSEEVLMACSEGIPTAEVLMSAFLQKRLQKESPPSGNSPELQSKIDEAKRTEWSTLSDKPAIKVWTGAKAKMLRDKYPERFIGSRFVITEKTEDQDTRIKARWCLQGHLDPDFKEKIDNGLCHSPTLSQLARALVLQVLSSKKWTMCLGDIKGAFLQAGPLQAKYRPLFARHPAGGIPGLDDNDVIEVVGNVYGANDAPLNWYQTFHQAVTEIGYERSQFDNCLYFLRDKNNNNELCSILGAHVDDTIIGGHGPIHEKAVALLRSRFTYRKWRIGHGEFCGVHYSQDPSTF